MRCKGLANPCPFYGGCFVVIPFDVTLIINIICRSMMFVFNLITYVLYRHCQETIEVQGQFQFPSRL